MPKIMFAYSVASHFKNTLSVVAILVVLICSQTAVLAQANKQPVAQNITTAGVPNNNAAAKAIAPLSATDVDGSIVSFKILTLPGEWHGFLFVNNVAATAGQVITPVQAAQLSFRSPISYETTATFTYAAIDNAGAQSAPATYTIPIIYDVDLTISHSIITNLPFGQGQEVTVRYTVTNLGVSSVYDHVYINNLLPAELTFVRTASESWRHNLSTNTWNLQGLRGKETKTVEIIAKLNTKESFSHTTTVSINGQQKDHNLTNNSSNYSLIQQNDAPSVQNVSVTMGVASTEGTVTAISPLKANVRQGRSLKHFTLTSVPNPSNGKLYVNDRMARQGQQISEAEATALSFEPSPAYEGEAVFRYTATDNLGATSIEPAIYNITIMSMTLPVSLIDFKAQAQTKGVALAWATASEKDNAYFSVERSQDGLTFKAIGKVKGAGNSSRKIDYAYLDTQAPAGVLYYRLKQVDTDGTHDFSKVVTVTAATSLASAQVQAYPNPFTQNLNLTLPAASTGQAHLQLLDLQGRVMQTQVLLLESGQNTIQVTTEALPAGAYILIVKGNGIDSKARVIKS
ncbi:T9SS type A sorting domain-containing protein [Pontibacter qinzhouensis]|uniref:T9SS type A sorting domain-containing protein n=1 Tax=Pontibacter qinzhouensis TaxID=2603253 RepID=A0A5C8KAW5_9BACT|nr:T9SS type A sorting domain-containing protein [Pontibacter qinzhouensis]TXK49694.1 T9SS type A sorting domain-containing protein [Pontibacter qinzhouensis]